MMDFHFGKVILKPKQKVMVALIPQVSMGLPKSNFKTKFSGKKIKRQL